MENHVDRATTSSDLRTVYTDDEQSPGDEPLTEVRPSTAVALEELRIPVGTNLADVERWLIFATLQKCGGNKTRAAALLCVSLKTLYNRLNAYRAQGLAMDYAMDSEPQALDASTPHKAGADLREAMLEVPQRC
jgi:DNA-binding NtrC family response regulator